MLKAIAIIEIILVISSMVCFVTFSNDNKSENKLLYSDIESNETEQLLEEYIFKFVNEERAKAGRDPLEYDAELSKVSKSHATDMWVNNYYSHFDLEGKNPIVRAAEAGYDIYSGRCYVGVGENIHNIRLNLEEEECNPEKLARRFVDEWMGSFSHYRNILRPFYHSIGIGVTGDEDGNYYAVQNFR